MIKGLKKDVLEKYLREFELALEPETWNLTQEIAFYYRLPQPFNNLPLLMFASGPSKTLQDPSNYELKDVDPEGFTAWLRTFQSVVNYVQAPIAEKIIALEKAASGVLPSITKLGPNTIVKYQHMLAELITSFGHPNKISAHMFDEFAKLGSMKDGEQKWSRLAELVDSSGE